MNESHILRIYAEGSPKPIEGCVAFDYRGFTISLSNIFTPAQLLVWRTDDPAREVVDEDSPTAEGFRRAMDWIDHRLDGA